MEEQTLQEVGVVSTPEAFKPNLAGKRELEPTEAARLLHRWIWPYLSDPEDLETFEVRQGVTYYAEPTNKAPLLEVFLRDRMYLVPVSMVAGVIERKTEDIFARQVLERLRDRFHYKAPTYNRMEVLFECLYEMRDLLPEGIPECHDFPENSSAHLRRQINLIKERVKKLSSQKVKQAMPVGRRG